MMQALRRWRFALMIPVVGLVLFWWGATRVTVAQAEDDFQWAHRLGNNQNSQSAAVGVNSNGDIFVAGTFRGNMDVDPHPDRQKLLIGGAVDAGFIVKYDAAGTLIWARALTGNDQIHIRDLVIDDTGHIGLVGTYRGEADLDPGTGRFMTVSNGLDDIFLVRLSPEGLLDWAWAGGSIYTDHGVAIATDSRAGLTIAGGFEATMRVESSVLPDSPSFLLRSRGEDDAFSAHFTSDGMPVWARAFGGKEDDTATDIARDAADNVYIVGSFEDKADLDPSEATFDLHSYGQSDIFVTILNAEGNLLWSTQMGGVAEERDALVLVEADGSFYVSGEFEGRANFNRTGKNGIITNPGTTPDVFLTRYSAGRNFEWVTGLGSSRADSLAAIAQDAFGRVYLLGGFENSIHFYPGSNGTVLTGSGLDDIFLASYTRQGQLRRARGMVNPLDDFPAGVAIDPENNVIFTGYFYGNLDLGSGLTVSTGQPETISNVFLARYARDTWTPLPLRTYFPSAMRGEAR